MSWDEFCDDILSRSGRLLEYVSVRVRDRARGECGRCRLNYERLADLSMSVIYKMRQKRMEPSSWNPNFRFESEDFILVKNDGDIFTYLSPERSIAYGEMSHFFVVVISCESQDKETIINNCELGAREGVRKLQEYEM
ncbi:uncharacterized protein LOC143452531 [Clavelina lepadiformis]|uniref:Uncharacterized protein n=1 Tax=Clavelina lepadiformis TaxID=159417 RepID=A0ABP0GJH2_CLALP